MVFLPRELEPSTSELGVGGCVVPAIVDEHDMHATTAARRLRCVGAHLYGAHPSEGECALGEGALSRSDEALLSLSHVVAETTEKKMNSSYTREMTALESVGESLRVYKTGTSMVLNVLKMGIDFRLGSFFFFFNDYYFGCFLRLRFSLFFIFVSW